MTWYSKLAAVIIFVGTFVLAFNLGIEWEKTSVEQALIPESPVEGGAGAHCGGFIKDAPTCAVGYHCQLVVSRPDTGGTCVKD